MKTVKEIQQEEATLRKEMDVQLRPALKRTSKQLEQLRQYRYYIETAPSEECLRRQLADLQLKLEIVQSRFGQWCAHKTGGRRELLAAFNKAYEVPTIKAQIKTLKYLLQ